MLTKCCEADALHLKCCAAALVLIAMLIIWFGVLKRTAATETAAEAA